MLNVSLAQATQHIMHKNFLAEEAAPNLIETISELGGLPADPFTSPYLSLLARQASFEPHRLQTALKQQALVMRPLMRDVPYVVPVSRMADLHAATARQRNKYFNAQFRLWGIEQNEEIEQLGERILATIDDSAMSEAALIDRLPGEMVTTLTQTSRGGRVSQTNTVALALRWLVANGRLLAVDEAADWREQQLVYDLPENHGVALNPGSMPDEAQAQKQVVRRYLAAFGPATEADISFWTGFGKSETARAVGGLSGETTLTMVQGIPGMLLSLKSQAESLKETKPLAGPVVAVLPANDPYVTAHRASRSRYFDDQSLQRRVFRSSGAARPTLLVDGKIVGVWDWSRTDAGHQLEWSLLAEVSAPVVAQLEAGLQRVAAFIDPNATVQPAA